MFDADEILRAAEITDLPPGVDKTVLAEQILKDHLVGLRAVELAAEHFGAEALRRFHPLEKVALRKRFGLEEKPAKPRIEWSCGTHIASGKITITATCAAETIFWSGPVEDLKKFRWRGEGIPADIQELYRLSVVDGNDPEYAAARRDRIALETAQQKQAQYEAKTKNAKQW